MVNIVTQDQAVWSLRLRISEIYSGDWISPLKFCWVSLKACKIIWTNTPNEARETQSSLECLDSMLKIAFSREESPSASGCNTSYVDTAYSMRRPVTEEQKKKRK